MCPLCLTSIAVTVGTTTGAGALLTAVVVGARRMFASPQMAEIIREVRPLDEGRIHGVTFDGTHVWFARDGELVAFDPSAGQVVHRHRIAGANAGTAFDGEHLYQLAGDEILVVQPKDGRVVRRLPAPGVPHRSGMAWADGFLWVGEFDGAKIHKVDPRNGEVVKTLTSNRFVTGVSWSDGALWHGAMGDGKPCELRRLGEDGRVDEVVTVEVEALAGMEAAGDGAFWCAGERGTLRLVRPSARRR